MQACCTEPAAQTFSSEMQITLIQVERKKQISAQPMLVAPNIRAPLLCASPAFQDFAHGCDNPPACAAALHNAQRMCQLNMARA
jgi:hypothetical protein